MLAGTLTKRITLFRPKRIRQPLGSEKVVAEKVTEIWAKAEAISNKKIRTADQQQVIETMRFTVRPREDVAIDWLIDYQQRRFTVRAIDRDHPDRLIITTEADSRHDRV
ncbi:MULTISPECIES: phage head closure protein [Arsenophonus]|uniref:Phage head closure protein n=1 Tax=Arsenophonus nasoniae TaxID=638 RepID=A0AA95GNI9_9GAMM|nr:phage head closure protein [Arsenophonus nasoniae]WGM01783.1 phage head closure protein [Arsenophonus nasoniae]